MTEQREDGLSELGRLVESLRMWGQSDDTDHDDSDTRIRRDLCRQASGALLATLAKLAEAERLNAVAVARDKYLCGLLVEWSVRENDGEDHCSPPEHILRGLIKCAEERKQALRERDARIADLTAQLAMKQYAWEAEYMRAEAGEQALAAMRGQFDTAVRALQDIAAMGKKAGSETAAHTLHQLKIDTPDYGSMT